MPKLIKLEHTGFIHKKYLSMCVISQRISDTIWKIVALQVFEEILIFDDFFFSLLIIT